MQAEGRNVPEPRRATVTDHSEFWMSKELREIVSFSSVRTETRALLCKGNIPPPSYFPGTLARGGETLKSNQNVNHPDQSRRF